MSKIREDTSVLIDEDILWLDVIVNKIFRVYTS